MTIRCIAFDLDDTFWDCRSVIEHAERQLYAWLEQTHPVITDANNLEQLVGSRMQFMKQFPELHYDLGLLRKNWLNSLAKQYALPNDWIEPAFEHFLQARNEVQLFPGVTDALSELSKNYKLGVITNGNAEVKRIGMDHYFDFTLSSAEAGVAKPDPAIFQQALVLAGVEAHEMVYVGDDPEKDIIGANRSGLRTIWFNPSLRELREDVYPDAIMTKFTEIARLVQLL